MGLSTNVEGEALRAFGIEATAIAPSVNGHVNRHWIVSTSEGRVVLRRYRADRSREAIAFEHALLGHAAKRAWPVAAPIEARGCGRVAEVRGSLFSVFPFLEGEPAARTGLGQRRIAGRLLARLHHDLRDFDKREQRPGFGRAWELDIFVREAGEHSFNGLLGRFGREHRELAAAVRRERYRNLRELARLGYGELPIAPVHCDFGEENLLFRDGALSGVLDFDLARLDAPIYDVAAGWLAECMEAPGYDAIDVEMARAFVQGYASHRPLGEVEANLLVPLVRAATLWLCMFRLLQWMEGGQERAVASIARTVERRFPALDARASALRAVALAETS